MTHRIPRLPLLLSLLLLVGGERSWAQAPTTGIPAIVSRPLSLSLGKKENPFFTIGLLRQVRNQKGLQIGPVTVADSIRGAQLASFVNIAAGSARGLQMGLSNTARTGDKLVQIGLINGIATEQRGLQLGAYNYAGVLNSPQIGLFNVSGQNPRGTQIGLVNISQQSGTRQIGLANITPQTDVQLLLWGGSLTKINAAVRLTARHFYSVLGAGFFYRGLDDHFSGSLFFRRGIRFQLSNSFTLSGDLGYAHIEDTPKAELDNLHRRYALQGRINAELKLSRTTSAFISSGYSFSGRYRAPHNYTHRPIVEAGIALF